jgi:hypothetical protein
VTQTRGGPPNVQVRVLGSWFALGDEAYLRPVRQREHRAPQAVSRAGLSAALAAAHAAARAARTRGARDAAAAWATAWAAQLTQRAARGRTAAQLGLCAAELAAGTAQHGGLASGTALQVRLRVRVRNPHPHPYPYPNPDPDPDPNPDPNPNP